MCLTYVFDLCPQLESCQRKVTALQKQLKESQEKSEREAEAGRSERTDLLRQLAESKHGQHRDRQKVEEVLAGVRLFSLSYTQFVLCPAFHINKIRANNV